jgi:RNA polymerase sigma-70 factor (ECF subfamily)
MPQTLAVSVFVFGAVLILIALLGGRFRVFGAEIMDTVGRVGRIIAGFAGLLILVGLFLTEFHVSTPPLFPPKIIATNPKNGAADVDPSLSKITVTFSKPMMDNSWSWVSAGKSSYPKTTGDPYYAKENTCVLPVELEPGKSYVIWINGGKYRGFQDKTGNAVEPYKLVFTTRQN